MGKSRGDIDLGNVINAQAPLSFYPILLSL